MSKKMISAILAILLIVGLLSSCSTKNSKSDNNSVNKSEEEQSEKDVFREFGGVWKDPDRDIYVWISATHSYSLVAFNHDALKEYIKQYLFAIKTGSSYSKDRNQDLNFNYLGDIYYFYDSPFIEDNDDPGFQYGEDENGEYIIFNAFQQFKENTCYPTVDSPKLYRGNLSEIGSVFSFGNTIKKQIEEEIESEWAQKDDQITQQYGELPDEKTVRFDKANNNGTLFMMTGTACLDDYYNYGYIDCEKTHFCIEFIPVGNTSSDRWFVYADRESFESLYSTLFNDDQKACVFICKFNADKNGRSSSPLAELEDYIVY